MESFAVARGWAGTLRMTEKCRPAVKKRGVARKKTGCAALCFTLVACLSGCSAAGAESRELEGTVLVQVLGVDAWGSGVALTAAGADGEEETAVECVRAGSLEEAFAALPAAGEKRLSLTSVAHLLVGDGVELEKVLEYVLNDPDMSYMAEVWAVNGFAGAVMEELEDGGIGRLGLLKSEGGITVKTALAELLEGGTALPALAVKDGQLEPAGTLYIEVEVRG